MSAQKIERSFVATNLAIRAAKDDKALGILNGLAAVFNSLSQDLGGYRERLAPGCFSRALLEHHDVRCLFNHDANAVLGRTVAGTLRLEQNSQGLAFECDLPDTSIGRDVHTMVARGDISQCSFGFCCLNDDVSVETDPDDEENTIRVRTVRDLSLLDVSAVTYPAYTATSVQARSARYAIGRNPIEPRNHRSERVELVSPEERAEIADLARRDRVIRAGKAIDADQFRELDNFRKPGESKYHWQR